MLEHHFIKSYNKYCIQPLIQSGILNRCHPNLLTSMGCLTGIISGYLAANKLCLLSFFLLLLSGFLDTLDGSLARHLKSASNKGSALDIFSDRVVESALILGLYLYHPEERALPCLLMLIAVLICITSFLIVGIFTEKKSEKSFFYSPGIMERAEAFIFFSLMLLFPNYFGYFSYPFFFLVLLTALIRMYQFLKHYEST